MDKKRVYTFGNGQAEGKADMRNLLGGINRKEKMLIKAFAIDLWKT